MGDRQRTLALPPSGSTDDLGDLQMRNNDPTMLPLVESPDSSAADGDEDMGMRDSPSASNIGAHFEQNVQRIFVHAPTLHWHQAETSVDSQARERINELTELLHRFGHQTEDRELFFTGRCDEIA